MKILALLILGLSLKQIVAQPKAAKADGLRCLGGKSERPPCEVSFTLQGCFNKSAEHENTSVMTRDYEWLSSVTMPPLTDLTFDEWMKTQPDFVCRCASKAKEIGYGFFALQNPYICYGGPVLSFTTDDKASPEDCISSSNKTICSANETLCVGGRLAVSVYKIVPNEPHISSTKNIECKTQQGSRSKTARNTASSIEASKRDLRRLFGKLDGVRNATHILLLAGEIITTFKDLQESYSDFTEYQEKFMTILSKLLGTDYKLMWKQAKQIQNLVAAVEELPQLLLHSMAFASKDGTQYSHQGTNIHIAAKLTVFNNGTRMPTPLEFHGNSTGSSQHSITMDIPAYKDNHIHRGSAPMGVAAILYKDIEDIYPTNIKDKRLQNLIRANGSRISIASPVISIVAQLNDQRVTNMNGTIHFKTHPGTEGDNDISAFCVFWEKNTSLSYNGAWSTSGVELVGSNHGNASVRSCSTNHLTSFAILMQTTDFEVPAGHQKALEIITYVGCAISLVCLILTIVSLPVLRLTSIRYKIHQQLCASLAVSQALFLAGIAAIKNEVACMVMAMLLHYFYTAAFSWMLVEGLHLYIKVVIAYETKPFKKLYYYFFGWGFPLVVVGICFGANRHGYGTETGCWLSLEKGFRWAFITPVLLILLINICIMMRVLIVMMTLQNDPLRKNKKQKLGLLRTGAKGLAILLPLLGLTWLFGVLSVNSQTIAFQYIFAILNTLQGAFIFLFNFVGNREVRSSFRTTLQRSQRSQFSTV